MATVTLRPDSTSSSTGWSAVGGAGTHHGNTSDDSDASYTQQNVPDGSGFGTSLQMTFTTSAIPAAAQIRSVQPRARCSSNPGVTNAYLSIAVLVAGAGSSDTVMLSSTIATATGAARTLSPDGDAWSQADIDALTFACTPGWLGWPPTHTAFDARLFEVYADVVYNERPVATVTAPAEGGTVTNDSQPSVTWTYSDPESDAQERVRVKVFAAAQYGAGGFDPETSAATWDSGEVFTSATAIEIGVALANGTYRAYVKVADAGSSGRYSAWDYNQWTQNITPPPEPTITATVQSSQARTKIDVTAAAGAPNTEFVTVEFSDDAGATWATLRGGGKTTLAPLATLTVYDYEAPPGASRRYRAKSGRTVT